MRPLRNILTCIFAPACLVLVLSGTACWGAEPTLARLSFWAPPERMAEFEAAYRETVEPVLKQHRLVEASERGRATVDSVFSRLFAFKTPDGVARRREALEGDMRWVAVLQALGAAFGAARPDSLIRHSVALYSTPAGKGTVRPAGSGRAAPAGPGQGHWQSYEMTGAPDVTVMSMLQDRKGNLWFATRNGAVRYDGRIWTALTMPDPIQDARETWVHSILQDREGNFWFSAGGGVIRYDGQKFTTFKARDGLAGNGVTSILQDRKDNLWFGTQNGVSRYDGETFTTFTEEDGLALNRVRSILQDREGNLWFGCSPRGASRYDPSAGSPRPGSRQAGQAPWTTFTTKDGLTDNRILSILQDRDGNLWFGTQDGGVSRYDGKAFTSFTPQDGLAGMRVDEVLQDREGDLWFTTDNAGVSRYDGKVFQTLTRRDGLAGNGVRSIFQDREGALWFGTADGATRFRAPEPSPPPVYIDAVVADRRYEGVSEVHIPSTVKLTAFEFHGISFKTRPEAMVYRYRLTGHDADWQVTRARRVEYADLPLGSYTFEVEAVDRDLVYSEAPARVRLAVQLPYERIGWMSALGIAVALIAWQAGRLVQRDRRLQEANVALSSANRELFQANRELQRDRAVERIRGEVQAMERASDFEEVLSLLATDLKEVGIAFDTCGIDVLDEPVDDPSMDYFVEKGFHYTTYKIDPEGRVAPESYHIPAPFPDVFRGTIERFATGQPWQGRDADLGAIVEVPASSYARLRLTASDRRDFSEDEIETLQEFASAIALGYARYLDFHTIQEQTERKSRFLASMSHELRTPMTAIKGYVDNMLDGIGGELTERQRRNLTRVTQNSDHLLHLINDILDLSKIEAGRMDVEAKRFQVEKLVAGCCDAVGPLVKAGVKLSYEVGEGAGEAETDEGRLRQIVINLLSNALKFTDQGQVAVRVSRDGGDMVIAVSDTGTGIPADALESIFEEFHQVEGTDRERKGTGLGLPITKGYAELLGGSIAVRSEVRKGSTFTVRVPMVYGGG